MQRTAFLGWSLLALLGLTGTATAADPTYSKDVKPFLARYCVSCHSSKQAKAGVNLESFQAMMKGDRRGRAIVVANDPDGSKLLQTMEGKAKPMPPKKSRQPTAKEIALVRDWIAAGAKNDGKAEAPLPDRQPRWIARADD